MWELNEPSQRGWGSLLFRTRGLPPGTVALRMTSIHLGAKHRRLISPLTRGAQRGCTYIVTARASVPLKSVFALRSEIVDVGLEMQFEDVVLVNVFGL